MRKCRGCGAVLQSTDPEKEGYTPKEDSEYCQRCYRLIHYDDLMYSMRTGIDPDTVIQETKKLDGMIVWVVDLFDFEAGMIPGINRLLAGRPVILAANKMDLFPETYSEEKAARFIYGRLREYGIQIQELVFLSARKREGLEDLKNAIEEHAGNRPVIFIGRANSGKSTLLNALSGSSVLTMSRYPGTTLAFNELEIDGRKYIDTPGIEISRSMLMEVREEDLKQIIPERRIKPTVYQLKGDQSFQVGGLVRLDLMHCEKASCVWYISNELPVHRSKVLNASQFWNTHYGHELRPVPLNDKTRKYAYHKDMEPLDVVIDGLGWACVHGNVSSLHVQVPENVSVTFRKGMI